MGATWDLALVEEVGLKLLAEEAKLRAASLVLAPTCNIQRVSRLFIVISLSNHVKQNPLGGRVSPVPKRVGSSTHQSYIQSFESFSEDPFLSGMIAASYVNGVQKGGIGTTIKHFVYEVQSSLSS